MSEEDRRRFAEIGGYKQYGGPQGIDYPISREDWEAAVEPSEKMSTFYGTFGLEQRLVSYINGGFFDANQRGIPLGDKYVRILASDMNAARLLMIEHFGSGGWCNVYTAERWPQTRTSKQATVKLMELP